MLVCLLYFRESQRKTTVLTKNSKLGRRFYNQVLTLKSPISMRNSKCAVGTSPSH